MNRYEVPYRPIPITDTDKQLPYRQNRYIGRKSISAPITDTYRYRLVHYTYVFLCNNLLISIITFFIIFKLRILARGLVGIQDYNKKYALIDEQATKKIMKKFFLAIFPCMIVSTIGVSLSVVGSNVIIFSKLDVPTVWQSLLYSFNVLIFMIYGTPFWYFFFIYVEISAQKN